MFLLQFLVGGIAAGAFAILYLAPRRQYLACAFVGGLGWMFFYLSKEIIGISVVISYLIASFVVTETARILAIYHKVPGTIFLVIGIFPLVPGAGIYYTAYYLFMKDSQMAGQMGLSTFETSLAIVLGIIIGSALPRVMWGQQKHR